MNTSQIEAEIVARHGNGTSAENLSFPERLTIAFAEIERLRQLCAQNGAAQAQSRYESLSAEVEQLQTALSAAQAELSAFKQMTGGADPAQIAELHAALAAAKNERDQQKARADKALSELKPLNQKVAEIMAQVGQPIPIQCDPDGSLYGDTISQQSRGNATDRCKIARRHSEFNRGPVPIAP